MNKQEQIEKMAKSLEENIVYDDVMRIHYGLDEVDFETTSENLLQEGYINGADFVEWLKTKCDNYSCDTDSDITWQAIDVDDLEDLLQEYLKGE